MPHNVSSGDLNKKKLETTRRSKSDETVCIIYNCFDFIFLQKLLTKNFS